MNLDRLSAAQARLLARIDGLSDHTAQQPSLLPGWTVGHVLSHLARNADSVVRRLEGAARDEIVDQYPGGFEGRAREIDDGATAPAAHLVDDVRATNLAVERLVAQLPEEAWTRPTRSVSGQLDSAFAVLESRIREVEVHHVDLDLGYRPVDWPAEFVRDELAIALPQLADRADPAQLLGWLIGRAPAPTLAPWR